MSNFKKSFLMGGTAAGASLFVSAFFAILSVNAACTNPATIPTGFEAPCPVFSLSSNAVTQAQTLTLSATPQAGTDYIYTTAYVSNGTTWTPYTLSGNNAYSSYSSALASLTLSSAQLSSLSLGTHYAVVWDWLWDATANCYKGPGLNQCNTGTWRVQSFSVTSSTTPTPTPTPSPTPTPTPTPTPSPAPSTFPDSVTSPISLPGTVQAEDYNFGGQNVGYYDTTVGNTGGAYRTDDVDIKAGADGGTGYQVGWFATGEWLKYTVNVGTAGTYTLDARVANGDVPSTFHLEVDGVNVTGALTVPSTGSWTAYTDVVKTGISLSAGTHTLRLYVDQQYFDMNWLMLTMPVPTPTPTPTPSSAIPSTFFGNHIEVDSDWPTAGMLTIGSSAKRPYTGWLYLERSRGSYTWTAMDTAVSTAQAHGVDVMWSNAFVPQWAASDLSTCTYQNITGVNGCTSYITNIADWDTFINALATRYKGKIKAYECWNEPDSFYTGTFAQMVTLCQHFYNDIRAIDPAALTIGPAPEQISASGTWLNQYFAAGGSAIPMDVMSYHGYPHHLPANNGPETIVEYATAAKNLLAQYGMTGKPMWDTEGSFGIPTDFGVTDANAQAAWASRSLLLHWSNGLTRFYWYAYDDSDWGTLYLNGTTYPAGTAYKYTQDWMLGATMNVPCAANGTVWTCGLKNSAGTQTQAVWNTAGSSSYTIPGGYGHYKDLTGATNTISGGTVTIGIKPILLVP